MNNFAVYLKTTLGIQDGFYYDLTEDEARHIYHTWENDPECEEILVIEGSVIASSTNPIYQEVNEWF